MANDSKVLIRLQMLGAAIFARHARQSSENLDRVGHSGRRAGAGLDQAARKGTRATTALTRVQAATKRTATGMQQLGHSASGALDPVKRIAQYGALASGVGFGAAVKSSADFEQGMANVQARLLTNQANMGKLNALALDLGAKTQFSAGQAADAMGELAAQGFTTRQIVKTLPGTLGLAAAAGTDLASAAEIQAATLRGFKLEAGDAARVADVLAQTANRSAVDMFDLQESLKYIAPVASATGQRFEDVAAAVGIMGNVGIKGSQAGTTLRTALVRLTKPTEVARGALANLGLKAGDLVGKKGLLSMPNIMGKIISGSKGVSKNTRNAALATIFGREALSGMVALVEGGTKKYDKWIKALDRSKGAAGRAAGIMRNTVKGAFDNLTGSIETAAITLTKRYMPAIKKVLNVGAGGVNNFTKGLTTGQATKVVTRRDAMGKKVRSESQPAAQRAGAFLHGAVSTVATGAQNLLKSVMPALKDAAAQFIDAIKPAMPFVQNVLLPLLEGIGKGILGSVVGAFKVAVPIIKLLATALGWVGTVLKPFRPIIQGVGMVIGVIFGGAILKAVAMLGKLGGVFRLVGAAAGAMRVPIRIVSGAVRIYIGVVTRLIGAYVRAITFIARFGATLTGGARKVIVGATNMVGRVIHIIETLPGKAAGLAGKVISKFASKLGGGVGAIVKAAGKIGKGVIDGVVKAIKESPGAIVGAIESVIPGPLKGAVKKVIGIVPGIATGGVVQRSGMAVVGERGPELANFPRGTTVYDHRQTARALAARRAQPTMAMAAPAFPPITIHFRPEIDGKPFHSSVHRIERAKVEAQ